MHEAAATVRSRGRMVAEWGLRLFLALVFVYAGIQKFPSAPGAMWVKVFENIGLGQWFRYFTGVVEVLGGGLLLVPAATIVAVPLLVCTMVGAIIVHVLVVGTGPQTVAVSVLLAGLFGIWVMRRRAVGIRTARTLSDRSLWIRLHRTCGYVAVGFGTIVIVSGLLLAGPAIGLVVGMTAFASIAWLAMSYRRLSHA